MKSAMQVDIIEYNRLPFWPVNGCISLIYGLMSPISGIIADRKEPKMVNWKFICLVGCYILRGEFGTFQQIYWPQGN